MALWAALTAFLTTAFCVPLVRGLPVVDPSDVDASGRPMPRAGGLALLLGLAVPLVWWRGAEVTHLAVLAAAYAIGLHDDLRDSSPKVRLGMLAALATVAAAWMGGLPRVSVLGFAVDVGPLAVPLAAAWILGCTVAFDFADGLDGLAAGLVLVAGGGLYLAHAGAEGLILAGAAGAFLLWNRPRASIYMGDAGSNLLGFAVGLMMVLGLRDGAAFPLLAGLLLVAVPVADTAISLARRAGAGDLFAGDTDHLHHRLDARFGAWGALGRLLGGAIVAAGVAVLLLGR